MHTQNTSMYYIVTEFTDIGVSQNLWRTGNVLFERARLRNLKHDVLKARNQGEPRGAVPPPR